MNSLEKIFNSIKSSNTKEMKLYSTRELIKQLREYADHKLCILKNIYTLVSSENTHNRLCGTKLLYALPWFEYAFNFEIDTSVKASDYVYLQSKELLVESGPKKDVKGEIKRFLDLEHVGAEFVENNDIAEQGFVSISLKTADVREKSIENVYDFFEAINLILLSPDWFKRHGGFLSYCAIVASANRWDFDRDVEQSNCDAEDGSTWIGRGELVSSPIKVVLSGDLFNKIFEIFKNDKFNDFVGDVTSSPVKEAACLLLKYIYPLFDNKLVLFEITHLLTSEDWQEQFSALLALSQLKPHFNSDLINGTGLLVNFVSLLINLLQSLDEDVKFLSADLLSYIVTNFHLSSPVLSQILDACWTEISGDVDVSHASILILLKEIYSKGNLSPPSSFAPLYPCFTSHLAPIRTSTLALAQVFDGSEFTYLLAEAILLETSGSYIQADILRSKISGIDGAFATYFLRIISQGILKPYSEDDFACYNESFFTVDGIKSITAAENMNNRAVLFGIILDVDGAEHSADTLLARTYKALYEQRSNTDRPESGNRSDSIIIQESIEDDFKQFSSLKKMPIKEFKAIADDPFYRTVYTNSAETFIELLRLKVAQNIFSITDLNSYIILENSIEMLKVITRFILRSPNVEKICENFIDLTIKLTVETRGILISEVQDKKRSKTKTDVQISYRDELSLKALFNLKAFFKILGPKLISLSAFKYLLELPDRLIFFEECAEFLAGDNNMDQIFTEALEKENAKIINKLISNVNYNCQFVRKMLENFNSRLLSQTIEQSNPSFNVLFVKPVLRAGNASANLLSRILCSLHFMTDEAIHDEYLIRLIEAEREEVKMLIDPSAIKEYSLGIDMSIELRGYQKEGVKWISFLSRFNLNGILADDMGLGKTVQTLCYVLNEMYSTENNRRLLILCPASLSTHWQEEIRRVFGIESVIYDSKNGKTSRIVIMSYDMFRRDTSLEGTKWYFTVLDEGHLLKNRGTVLYSKCKRIISEHMIILTGTPVHNSTEDLFSLFELIQPGYLGDESTFNSQYGCRVTEKNVKAMEKRLEALHKKTVPFIMRRLKSEVLTDLPPKIIKDLVIDMDSKQEELYKRISGGCRDEEFGGYASLKSSSLSILKDSLKAASHPFYFSKDVGSAKTAALLELFSMCGNSKVLVFFQLKSTIDYVIEETGLNNYLRLDGSVPVAQRGSIVSRFNTEAISYLFLTTAIGGLGLNLTAADVVVFYEHDWNPFNDLQAMDRAHRLGQKKTVNVFRLICRGTIEEKVMNYQNFKLYVANTIVTQQNNDIQKMETKDILEKFRE